MESNRTTYARLRFPRITHDYVILCHVFRLYEAGFDNAVALMDETMSDTFWYWNYGY